MHIAYLHTGIQTLRESPDHRPRNDVDALASFASVTTVGPSDVAGLHPDFHRRMSNANALNWAPAAAVFHTRHTYDAIVAQNECVGIPAMLCGISQGNRVRAHVVSDGLLLDKPDTVAALRETRVGKFLCRNSSIRASLIAADIASGDAAEIGHFVDCEFFRPSHVEAKPSMLLIGTDDEEATRVVDALHDVEGAISIASVSSPRNGSKLPVEVKVHSDWCGLRRVLDETAIVYVGRKGPPQAACTNILHAMAMGKPVIATRTIHSAELFEDGVSGFFVAPDSPTQIRPTAVALFSDPGYCGRIGTQARKWCVERFHFDTYAERLRCAIQEN